MKGGNKFAPPRGYEPYSESEYERLLVRILGEDTLKNLKQSGVALPRISKLAAVDVFLDGPGELSDADVLELRYQIWALDNHGRFFFKGWKDV